jgi:membrane-associated phospholipid phosphatase
VATTAAESVLRPSVAPALVAPEPSAAGHPHRKSLAIVGIGYGVLTVLLLGIGMLLTHPLAHSVGGWDERVNEYFAGRRTATWDDITGIATAAFNTIPVVVAAAVLVGFLLLRRRVREAAFITLGLLVEITVFLSVTFLVARPRPDVVRLNSTPATSSFPSGHTAAATVLFAGIAIIVTCCTTRVVVRVASYVLAVLVVVAVGFGRVYRGLHHPTDVFVGVVFGLACLVVAALVVRAHGDALRADQKKRRNGESTAPASRSHRERLDTVSTGALRARSSSN